MNITEAVAQKVLDVIAPGLSQGLGVQEPGKMCVEAAVCYALGLPHGDNPPCVGGAVRKAKIRLNDAAWSSEAARAKGMRRVAIAQLGSVKIDQCKFADILAREAIRQFVPIALRAAAKLHQIEKHREALEVAAKECEANPVKASAQKAQAATAAAADAAYAARQQARDEILLAMAEVMVQALKECGSEGCNFLYLTEAQ